MMKKRVITWTLVVALAAAVPAFGIFGIPSPDELLIWFVLRPMMHGNQRTMIANQLLELQKLVEQLQTAQSQLTQVRNAAQGLVGAITDPMADLVAGPTDWLSTARDWHLDFTGQAGDMVGSIRDLADNGESFSQSWRDVFEASDTVTGVDIRNIYQSGPNAADAAVATFERQRAEGDRRLEYGVIARFVPEITLREELANNWTAEHYARFLAGLRCNGRALVRSAAPEFQLKSPVRMMWSQPRGETCLSNSGSGSRPFRRR